MSFKKGDKVVLSEEGLKHYSDQCKNSSYGIFEENIRSEHPSNSWYRVVWEEGTSENYKLIHLAPFSDTKNKFKVGDLVTVKTKGSKYADEKGEIIRISFHSIRPVYIVKWADGNEIYYYDSSLEPYIEGFKGFYQGYDAYDVYIKYFLPNGYIYQDSTVQRAFEGNLKNGAKRYKFYFNSNGISINKSSKVTTVLSRNCSEYEKEVTKEQIINFFNQIQNNAKDEVSSENYTRSERSTPKGERTNSQKIQIASASRPIGSRTAMFGSSTKVRKTAFNGTRLFAD